MFFGELYTKCILAGFLRDFKYVVRRNTGMKTAPKYGRQPSASGKTKNLNLTIECATIFQASFHKHYLFVCGKKQLDTWKVIRG